MKLHESLTADVICNAVENSMFGMDDPGFCVKCGEEHYGVEPDARRYPCDNGCGNTVYGAEELLLETVA